MHGSLPAMVPADKKSAMNEGVVTELCTNPAVFSILGLFSE